MVTSCGKKKQLSFHVPVGHLYALFGYVSIRFSAQFLILVWLFSIDLCELFIYSVY